MRHAGAAFAGVLAVALGFAAEGPVFVTGFGFGSGLPVPASGSIGLDVFVSLRAREGVRLAFDAAAMHTAFWEISDRSARRGYFVPQAVSAASHTFRVIQKTYPRSVTLSTTKTT